MKKMIIIVLIILGMFVFSKKAEKVMIPVDAIRFRIIANSDDLVDQETKLLVRNEIENEITKDLLDSKDLDSARNIINNNINKYENIVDNTLNANNIDTDFTINYGKNYFPEKIYKGVKYEEGDYESLVVTLGSGSGKNWWCVLFPPLCLLEAEEEQETTDVEYKFFIKEIIEKFMK